MVSSKVFAGTVLMLTRRRTARKPRPWFDRLTMGTEFDAAAPTILVVSPLKEQSTRRYAHLMQPGRQGACVESGGPARYGS